MTDASQNAGTPLDKERREKQRIFHLGLLCGQLLAVAALSVGLMAGHCLRAWRNAAPARAVTPQQVPANTPPSGQVVTDTPPHGATASPPAEAAPIVIPPANPNAKG